MQKPVIWSGAVTDPSGYGEASRNYVQALEKQNRFSIKVKPYYFWQGESVDLGDRLDLFIRLARTAIDMDRPHVDIRHLTPDVWNLTSSRAAINVGVTTFETDRLPDHWRQKMRSMDELWTFSHWAKDIFDEDGIRRPIHVVPHGVDIDMFCPDGEKLFDMGRDTFVFGSCFDWTERKNPTALIKAYYSAFGVDSPVALVLRAYYQGRENSLIYIKKYIERIRQEMGLVHTPPIVLISGMLSVDHMPALYRSFDAYVSASCGEGWGLGLSEAMAVGLPVIGVGWSGNTEFMNDENSLLLKNYTMKEITPAMAGHQSQYIGHHWADCDTEELSHAMFAIFSDSQLRSALSNAARESMKKFTWDCAAKVMADRIENLLS